jgi:hypothetical protein
MSTIHINMLLAILPGDGYSAHSPRLDLPRRPRWRIGKCLKRMLDPSILPIHIETIQSIAGLTPSTTRTPRTISGPSTASHRYWAAPASSRHSLLSLSGG